MVSVRAHNSCLDWSGIIWSCGPPQVCDTTSTASMVGIGKHQVQCLGLVSIYTGYWPTSQSTLDTGLRLNLHWILAYVSIYTGYWPTSCSGSLDYTPSSFLYLMRSSTYKRYYLWYHEPLLETLSKP